MGAGKTSIGKRLARALCAPFSDADEEIVTAAGLSIPESSLFTARRGSASWNDAWWRACWMSAHGVGAWRRRVHRCRDPREGDGAGRLGLAARGSRHAARQNLTQTGTRPLLESGDPREILSGLMESDTRSMPWPTTPSTRRPSRTRAWSSGSWRWSSLRRVWPESDVRAVAGGPGRAELRHHVGRRPARSGRRSAVAAGAAAADDRRDRREPCRHARIRVGSGGPGAGADREPDRGAASGREHQELAFPRTAGRGVPDASASSAARW